jgi:hypothetical protein
MCGDEGYWNRCTVLTTYKASLIVRNDITDKAERLRNPKFYDIMQPGKETRKSIHQ